MNNANDVIEKILEDARKTQLQKERSEQEEKERLFNLLLTRAIENLKDHPYLSWILDCGKASISMDGRYFYFRWSISAEGMDELKVCPIYVSSKKV